MNPFLYILTDFGITEDRHGKYADLFVVLSLAAELDHSYTGAGEGAYGYAIDYFTERFGVEHDFVRRFTAEFSSKAAR